MSSIPVIKRPLPEIASITGIPENTLCEFVLRRVISGSDGPADWGVPPDHPVNDPRRTKLSLEETVFVHEIYLDNLRDGGDWGDLRIRLDECAYDGEPQAQRIALDALNRYCEAQDRLVDRLHAAAIGVAAPRLT